MKAILLALAALPAACSAAAGSFTCTPGEVPRIRTAPGFLAAIAFRSDVADFATGFSSAWELASRGRYLFLKPREKGARTNLAVRTARGLCLFDLEEAGDGAPTYLLTEAPGEAEIRAKKEASERRAAQAKLLAPRAVPRANRAYTARTGSDPASALLVPAEAFDDGLFTTLRFAPGSRLPAAFVLEGGRERLAASHVDREGRLVLHGVYRELRLRLGGAVAGIRNESFAARLPPDGRTTVPGLVRETIPPAKENPDD